MGLNIVATRVFLGEQMMKFWFCLFAATILQVGALQASTVTIETLQVQNVPISGPSPQFLAYNEFNPDGGVLTRVDIDFFYSVRALVATAPQATIGGPIPYSGVIMLETGFSTNLGRGFSSSLNSFQTATVVATGVGEVAQTIGLQTYGFSFEAGDPRLPEIPQAVDPDGVGGASSFIIEGSVNDFLPINDLVRGVPITTRMDVSATSFDSRLTPLSVFINGSMIVTYTYERQIIFPDGDDADGPPGFEPPVDIPLAPVPLPAGAPLLLAGLAGLAWLRRRTRTDRAQARRYRLR